MPHGPRIGWTPYEVIERDDFGGEMLRLRIDGTGYVGRLLPHCGLYVRVLGDDYRPLTVAPMTCEEDALDLLARVRELR